jgi:hypothetical protein
MKYSTACALLIARPSSPPGECEREDDDDDEDDLYLVFIIWFDVVYVMLVSGWELVGYHL